MGNGVSFSCGESPWEGKLKGDGDENVIADDKSEEPQTSNHLDTDTMVSQYLFLHIVLLTKNFFFFLLRNKISRAQNINFHCT